MPDRAAPVRILFLDVEGTLTDGVIGFTKDSDFRNFWVRDGLALQWARGLRLLPVVIRMSRGALENVPVVTSSRAS